MQTLGGNFLNTICKLSCIASIPANLTLKQTLSSSKLYAPDLDVRLPSMIYTIVFLCCPILIMLGMIGKKRKETIKYNQELLNRAFQDIRNRQFNEAQLNFERAAACGSTRGCFWNGLFYFFIKKQPAYLHTMYGLYQRNAQPNISEAAKKDYDQAIYYWYKAAVNRHLSASVWIALALILVKGQDPDSRSKALEFLIFVVRIFERRYRKYSPEEIKLKMQQYQQTNHLPQAMHCNNLSEDMQRNNLQKDTSNQSQIYVSCPSSLAQEASLRSTPSTQTTLKSINIEPFKDYLVAHPQAMQFYLNAPQEIQDIYAYAQAMFILGSFAKEQAFKALQDNKLDQDAWKAALIYLHRCADLEYKDADLQLAYLYEAAASQNVSMASLQPIDAFLNFYRVHIHIGSWKYKPVAHADLFKLLLNLSQEQLWDKAYSCYLRAAQHGNSWASMEIGEHILQGEPHALNLALSSNNHSLPQSSCSPLPTNTALELAVAYLEQAELSKAWFILGEFYHTGHTLSANGLVTPIDYNRAVEYYIRSVYAPIRLKNDLSPDEAYDEYSETIAIRQKCRIYLMDLYHANLPRHSADHEEEFVWTKSAAEHGNVRAKFNLALLYRYGVFVEPDLDKAFQWYYAAAQQGNLKAVEELSELKRLYPSRFDNYEPHTLF